MTRKLGFSAIELAIILVIVGLSVASIIVGVKVLDEMPDGAAPVEVATAKAAVIEAPTFSVEKKEPLVKRAELAADSVRTSRVFSMGLPIDCTIGKECFVQNYVDHTADADAIDFSCGKLTYDGHKGTDFALRTLAQMKQGVNVLAAAGGTVRGVRDGMADKEMNSVSPKSIKDKECGNGLAIVHGNGWETQYCHMKKGSLKIKQGDTVSKGQVLGQVGLSGKTEFPHLHISVRKGAAHIDPFTAGNMHAACGLSLQRETLWEQAIFKQLNYVSTGYVASGFNDALPDTSSILARKKTTSFIGSKAPVIIYWAEFFGVQSGDVLSMKFTDAAGKTVAEVKENIAKARVRHFKYIGKKNKTSLSKGEYVAKYKLMRGNEVLSEGSDKVVVK